MSQPREGIVKKVEEARDGGRVGLQRSTIGDDEMSVLIEQDTTNINELYLSTNVIIQGGTK